MKEYPNTVLIKEVNSKNFLHILKKSIKQVKNKDTSDIWFCEFERRGERGTIKRITSDQPPPKEVIYEVVEDEKMVRSKLEN